MIKSLARRTFLKKGLSLFSALTLYGCGGGGGSTSNPSPPKAASPKKVAPLISSQPMDQSVSPGKIAIFQVRTDGSDPFFYQWQRNNTIITGATSRSYTTLPAMIGGDAKYSVVVSNSVGSVASRSAQLTVLANSTTIDSTNITVDSTQITVDSS